MLLGQIVLFFLEMVLGFCILIELGMDNVFAVAEEGLQFGGNFDFLAVLLELKKQLPFIESAFIHELKNMRILLD